mmetsp:Transcript_23462/g.48745  ORF Transcript_23462/g.48745 Transcript_23462/m.48745 type:complete len:256 (+) Transcript_23462:2424-3191(+)
MPDTLLGRGDVGLSISPDRSDSRDIFCSFLSKGGMAWSGTSTSSSFRDGHLSYAHSLPSKSTVVAPGKCKGRFVLSSGLPRLWASFFPKAAKICALVRIVGWGNFWEVAEDERCLFRRRFRALFGLKKGSPRDTAPALIPVPMTAPIMAPSGPKIRPKPKPAPAPATTLSDLTAGDWLSLVQELELLPEPEEMFEPVDVSLTSCCGKGKLCCCRLFCFLDSILKVSETWTSILRSLLTFGAPPPRSAGYLSRALF